MKVTAWNNGKHHETGAGYGLKISVEDRDRHFDRHRQTVRIRFPDGSDCAVNVAKSSFWNDTCRELISKEIGLWLIASGNAPWPKGHPPVLKLTPNNDYFELKAG